MSSPAVDAKDLLVAAGVGIFAAEAAWGIYVGKEPDAPDGVVTIYDTGGLPANPKWLLDYPSIQIRTRGVDYVSGYAKAQEVKDVLLGLSGSTEINSNVWRSVTQMTDITHIGYDKENRAQFTMNLMLIIEPALTAATNREVIT